MAAPIWIEAATLQRAGVSRNTMVERMNDGSWEWRRRDDDGVVELNLATFPDKLQKKLRRLVQDVASPPQAPASRPEDARADFFERTRIRELPEEIRTAVAEELSCVLATRTDILYLWRELGPAERRNRAAELSRAWVHVAKEIGGLYPHLEIYPTPLHLDLLASRAQAAKDGPTMSAILLDLDHLQLDKRALKDPAPEDVKA